MHVRANQQLSRERCVWEMAERTLHACERCCELAATSQITSQCARQVAPSQDQRQSRTWQNAQCANTTFAPHTRPAVRPALT